MEDKYNGVPACNESAGGEEQINADTDTEEKKKPSFSGIMKSIGKYIATLPVRIWKWIATAPLWYRIILITAALCALIHMLCTFSSALADFMIRYPNAAVRWILAHLTNFIPFSFAEMVIWIIPLLLAVLVGLGIHLVRKGSDRAYKKYLCALMCILFSLYSMFVLTLAPGYRGKPLDEKIGLTQQDVSAEQLRETALWLAEKTNEYIDGQAFETGGFSCMPYSLDEMNGKLNDAYANLADKYSFVSHLRSNLKYIILSEPMTYTHISGVYSYYTGEANINVNFPDYSVPFTAAHELAHQRGIAPENEANFVAFLACLESNDRYILYSAYSNMLEYCMSALYEADDDMYYEVYRTFDDRLIGEFNAYSRFYDKYRENVVGEVSHAINDSYLQSQGQKAGSKSYGLVVDLAVAYYYANAAE